MSSSYSTRWPPHMVAAVVVEQDGKFLLVHEHDGERRVYNQPAGHWDDGESLLEAAIREAREETGWEVSLSHIIGQYSYFSPYNQVTYFRTAFAAKPLRKVSDKLDKEIYRIEERIETPSDAYTEELKKKRLLVKDRIYAILSRA